MNWVLLVVFSLAVTFSDGAAPIAPHRTVTVKKDAEVVISLPGYDVDGDKLTTKIESLPSSGELFQLSHIFSNFGYSPKLGDRIASSGTIVTGSKNRLIYKPPKSVNVPQSKWAIFTYTISDGKSVSEPGIVWLVPSHKRIVFSDFSTSSEEWTVVGNGARAAAKENGGLIYEPFSRGLLNHYVMATESEINVNRKGVDLNLWYFVAPNKFHGNHVASYGGFLSFAVASAAGDFSTSSRTTGAPAVVIECDTCSRGTGIRLAVPPGDMFPLDGKSREISIPLTESNWRKDPKNTLIPLSQWKAPSKCEMVEVLSGITEIRILGDHTVWYETIALDSVRLLHGNGVPISCAGIYY